MLDSVTSDPLRAVEVYYDGACPVCRREIRILQGAASDAVIDWKDVSGEGAAAPDLDREAALARFHVRRADGKLISGAAAFFALWRNVRGLRPVAIALDRAPLSWLAERAYRGFLVVRRLWRRRD